jgi:hypothetical protein
MGRQRHRGLMRSGDVGVKDSSLCMSRTELNASESRQSRAVKAGNMTLFINRKVSRCDIESACANQETRNHCG